MSCRILAQQPRVGATSKRVSLSQPTLNASTPPIFRSHTGRHSTTDRFPSLRLYNTSFRLESKRHHATESERSRWPASGVCAAQFRKQSCSKRQWRESRGSQSSFRTAPAHSPGPYATDIGRFEGSSATTYGNTPSEQRLSTTIAVTQDTPYLFSKQTTSGELGGSSWRYILWLTARRSLHELRTHHTLKRTSRT